jgi:hypothetical protein
LLTNKTFGGEVGLYFRFAGCDSLMLKISGVKAHCLSPIRHEADMKDGMFQRDARFKRSSAKIGDSSLERMDHLCRRGLAAFAARFQSGEKAMNGDFNAGSRGWGARFLMSCMTLFWNSLDGAT